MSKEQQRKEWLERRRNHIGGSEVAAILGADGYRGPREVFESIVGGKEFEGNKFTRYGKHMEQFIFDMYSEETGREIKDVGEFAIQVNPEVPWLGVTLDRVIHGSDLCPAPQPGPGVLEAKTVHDRTIDRDSWSTTPPLKYQLQLQTQLFCFGSLWGSLVGLFPGVDLQHGDHLRNDRIINAMLPKLEEFWVKHILAKEPPPITESPRALELLKECYPDDTGEVIVFDEAETALAMEWLALGGEKAEKEARRKEIEIILRDKMKDATFADLTDGTFLSLKTQHRKGYVVQASKTRVLRHTKRR